MQTRWTDDWGLAYPLRQGADAYARTNRSFSLRSISKGLRNLTLIAMQAFGILIFFDRIRKDLVRHHIEPASTSLCHKVVARDLHELVDRCGFVAAAPGPDADIGKAREVSAV